MAQGIIEFWAAGVPRPQPRPRAFAVGGRARVYNPSTAEGWKNALAIAALPHKPPQPLAGPLRVDLDFFMPRPKGHYRIRAGNVTADLKPAAPHWHTRGAGKLGGDRDNLDKAVLDALQVLGFFLDDGQVCAGQIVKRYDAGAGPGCQITIAALPEQSGRQGGSHG